MTATFLLIRHGNCDPVGKFIAGRRPGIHLNQEGREQVGELAVFLKDIPLCAVYSSPLERTVETAKAIVNENRVQLEIKEELNEVDYGLWTGMSFKELSKEDLWGAFNTFRSSTRIPGGEMMPEVVARMSRFTEKSRRAADGVFAIVSHGDPIKALIAHYGGIPLDMVLRFEISTASVSVIELNDYGASIRCINMSAKKTGKSLL